jgi:hypothetical protein
MSMLLHCRNKQSKDESSLLMVLRVPVSRWGARVRRRGALPVSDQGRGACEGIFPRLSLGNHPRENLGGGGDDELGGARH